MSPTVIGAPLMVTATANGSVLLASGAKAGVLLPSVAMSGLASDDFFPSEEFPPSDAQPPSSATKRMMYSFFPFFRKSFSVNHARGEAEIVSICGKAAVSSVLLDRRPLRQEHIHMSFGRLGVLALLAAVPK